MLCTCLKVTWYVAFWVSFLNRLHKLYGAVSTLVVPVAILRPELMGRDVYMYINIYIYVYIDIYTYIHIYINTYAHIMDVPFWSVLVRMYCVFILQLF